MKSHYVRTLFIKPNHLLHICKRLIKIHFDIPPFTASSVCSCYLICDCDSI